MGQLQPLPRQQPHLTVGRAAKVGVDPEKLNLAASLIEEAVAKDKIPGAVILVVRKGKIILHQAFGHRDLQRTRPMQTDSLFRMASNSKAITAAGIMLLVEDGKLGLDEPVGTYLKAFQNERWNEITLRHLLTHTSGIRIKPLFYTPLLQKSETHPQAPDLRLEVNRFAASAPLEPAGKNLLLQQTPVTTHSLLSSKKLRVPTSSIFTIAFTNHWACLTVAIMSRMQTTAVCLRS